MEDRILEEAETLESLIEQVEDRIERVEASKAEYDLNVELLKSSQKLLAKHHFSIRAYREDEYQEILDEACTTPQVIMQFLDGVHFP